ncbi:hypothetical protein NUW58_g1303 [Xylaria curta]|uniref:Uncharacterized protein n=1 Tax=Xylaria curta TaxID=42375 RepID=A0ACC1PMK0_9PEZI|nr:hypothetical protein NUW58_g1303 [Xylaria curta]
MNSPRDLTESTESSPSSSSSSSQSFAPESSVSTGNPIVQQLTTQLQSLNLESPTQRRVTASQVQEKVTASQVQERVTASQVQERVTASQSHLHVPKEEVTTSQSDTRTLREEVRASQAEVEGPSHFWPRLHSPSSPHSPSGLSCPPSSLQDTHQPRPQPHPSGVQSVKSSPEEPLLTPGSDLMQSDITLPQDISTESTSAPVFPLNPHPSDSSVSVPDLLKSAHPSDSSVSALDLLKSAPRSVRPLGALAPPSDHPHPSGS